MSIDASLKAANSLIRHRNVLTRAERIERLTDADKFTAKSTVLGLPKVGNRKAAVIKKEKTVVEGDAAATPAAGAKGAAGAKPAGGAKGAAPAAGAKGAAPAGKAAAPAAKKK